MRGDRRKGRLRRGSATKPADAAYQDLCEYIVRFMRAQEGWQPYSGESGTEVEVPIGAGQVTLDIALRSSDNSRILIGECRGWRRNLPKEHMFALAGKMAGLAEATGAKVEGILFASTGFQSGLVRLAQGYGVRLAKVQKDQSPTAFTIAFADYDEVSRKVVFRRAGVGITEQVNVTDGGRIELHSPDGQVIGASDF